jgi:hypothetical protein
MTDVVNDMNPLEKMLIECDGDPVLLGERISAVLEFLTLRAVADGPFYIFTDNEDALVLFAAENMAKHIRERLDGIDIKRWEDELSPEANDFLSDRDPGDEQPEIIEDADESAAQPI